MAVPVAESVELTADIQHPFDRPAAVDDDAKHKVAEPYVPL